MPHCIIILSFGSLIQQVSTSPRGWAEHELTDAASHSPTVVQQSTMMGHRDLSQKRRKGNRHALFALRQELTASRPWLMASVGSFLACLPTTIFWCSSVAFYSSLILFSSSAATSAGSNASRISSATDLEAFEFGIDRLCHHAVLNTY